MTEPVSDETKFPSKQNRTAYKANKQTKAETDGSHADGLDYVPYDGYIAEVHKGEAILTKDDADLWRTSSNTVNNSNYANSSDITVNFSPVVNIQNATQEAKEDFLNILKQYKNEIADMVESVQNRRMARAY
ncbi:MAG: hypothetical protein LUH05_07020 [Candidatus Gastranaerophilales bacterium]|nr:hypothetical protein [Candidatus Gastranaerophilales bacterium]